MPGPFEGRTWHNQFLNFKAKALLTVKRSWPILFDAKLFIRSSLAFLAAFFRSPLFSRLVLIRLSTASDLSAFLFVSYRSSLVLWRALFSNAPCFGCTAEDPDEVEVTVDSTFIWFLWDRVRSLTWPRMATFVFWGILVRSSTTGIFEASSKELSDDACSW